MKSKSMEDEAGKVSTVIETEKVGCSVKKRSFWHINKQMLPYKMHFILFEAGMGTVLPYQTALGITKLGLTASNLAAAYSAQQFLEIFINLGIGYMADYFNKLKAVIVGLTVLQAVFCGLMIIIPRVDVPLNYVSHSNASLNDYLKCHLCAYSEELKNASSNQPPFNEDVFTQVLNCLKYSENNKSEHTVVHCPNEKINSSHSNSIGYPIIQTTCDDSLIDCFSSRNCTIPFGINFNDVLIISQHFDSSQNSLVLCFTPKGMNAFQDLSYSLMKQHCHAVSKPITIDLQDFLLAKLFNATDCLNYKSNVSANVELGHDDDNLSASSFKSYQFWLFSLCLIGACASIASIYTISDTACYESVPGVDYGRQRAWGAAFFGLAAPFAGFLNDYTEGYMASWCLMTLFCSLLMWNISKMNLTKHNFSQNILKDIKSVFSSFEFLAFETAVLMNGMFTGIIWFYLPWFLVTIGGNKLSIGLAYFTQCFLGEVPLMFASSWMIQKIGHFNLVSLALISHGIRFFYYSYLYDPWWVLPVELLHGFTFGAFYSTMTSYAKLNSKPGIEATTQSVLCTTYDGLGAGLGCVISGICFDYYGGHTTFFYASFLCVAATFINVVFTVVIGWRKSCPNNRKTPNANSGRFRDELEMNATEQQSFI